jgi:SAM-dependent methyltransferase
MEISFRSYENMNRFDSETWETRRSIERWLVELKEVQGYCLVCDTSQTFKVDAGVWFGDGPNLREGLLCTCGLSNRNRLLLYYIKQILKGDGTQENQRKVCFFEDETPLVKRFSEICRANYVSSFFSSDAQNRKFQDMTATTYRTGEFDMVVHNDDLEHIPDYKNALRDNWRILKDGGHLVFTTPFYGIPETVIRARTRKDGVVRHIRPPIYHGDPLRSDGILAYYDFGWSLYEDIKEAGFSDVAVCMTYDPICGFVSNNHPCKNVSAADNEYGNMLPVVFVCKK